MNTPVFSALIYLLGFIGLGSIGLLPVRSWQILVNLFKTPLFHIQRRVATVFIFLLIVAALWIEVQIVFRLFRCLTQTYCGPSIASGWIYLAILGAVYLTFEMAIFLMERICRVRTISTDS